MGFNFGFNYCFQRPSVFLLTLLTFGALFGTFFEATAETDHPPKKIRIVTTFTVIKDIAENVAGTHALVESITKPGAEIHGYQPTPQDIVKAQSADLVLWNGLHLEQWFEKFFANVKNVPSVIVSEGVGSIPIRVGLSIDKPNPHAWMSTKNALIYIENIRNALAAADPPNAESYAANAKDYAEKISNMAASLKEKLSNIPDQKRWLVTSEGAFSYLARDLNMHEAYLWPVNADQQGTPQQMRDVIEIVRKNNVPVVFSESTVSDKPARRLAQETGARYGGVLYVDSLSGPTGPVPTYIDLLKVTVETIAKGFVN